MTRVKICGIQTPEAAKLLAACGVDYAGFVFAPSRRKVSPADAGALIAEMREGESTPPLAVGVFRDAELEDLCDTVREARLDIVQLHGSEKPELCQAVRVRTGSQIIKVFSISGHPGARELIGRMAPYVPHVDAVMLDTHDPVYGGGSGKVFRWEVIPEIKTWTQARGIPLFVAGGLNADNVTDLLGQFAPDAVDISGGVETEGSKDLNKIEAFVRRVRTQ